MRFNNNSILVNRIANNYLKLMFAQINAKTPQTANQSKLQAYLITN